MKMERLTIKREDGRWALAQHPGASPREMIERLPKAIDRLAAYENSGLEPCDYAAMKAALERCEEAKKQLTELICIVGGRGFERTRELAEADKEGRLVVLPCKVGDTVYAVKFATHEENEDGDLMPIAGGGKWVVWTVRVGILNYCDYRTKSANGYVVGSTQNGSGTTFDFDDFGKTVFLTREEAEAAMRGGKADG